MRCRPKIGHLTFSKIMEFATRRRSSEDALEVRVGETRQGTRGRIKGGRDPGALQYLRRRVGFQSDTDILNRNLRRRRTPCFRRGFGLRRRAPRLLFRDLMLQRVVDQHGAHPAPRKENQTTIRPDLRNARLLFRDIFVFPYSEPY